MCEDISVYSKISYTFMLENLDFERKISMVSKSTSKNWPI